MSPAKSYPYPSNWQDFESLCRDLYAAEWDDPAAELNGRNGDHQAGVDVFGHRGVGQDRESIGIQCKLKEQWSKKKVTRAETREEADKAKLARAGKSGPRALNRLIIATTALDVQAASEEAAALTADPSDSFTVETHGWDKINEMLDRHSDVRDRSRRWRSTRTSTTNSASMKSTRP